MSGFSFNTTAGASQSTIKPRLAGNEIYTVKFDGCEIQDIVGVKDPTMTYKVIKLKFSTDDGSFEHTVFEPKSTDFERTENEFTDKTGKKSKIPQPSNVESMMLFFKHAIDSINPTVALKIDSGAANLNAASWEDLRKLVANILDAGKGTSFKIKLLKNSKTGEATFPGFFASIRKEDNKAYVKNNFIGPKVAFSSYEVERIKKEASATPTRTASSAINADLAPEVDNGDGLDMNFSTADL